MIDPYENDWTRLRLREMFEKSGAVEPPERDMDGSRYHPDPEFYESVEWLDFEASISTRLDHMRGIF